MNLDIVVCCSCLLFGVVVVFFLLGVVFLCPIAGGGRRSRIVRLLTVGLEVAGRGVVVVVVAGVVFVGLWMVWGVVVVVLAWVVVGV